MVVEFLSTYAIGTNPKYNRIGGVMVSVLAFKFFI